MSLSDLTLYQTRTSVGAVKIAMTSDDFHTKYANQGSFDQIWNSIGDNKYLLGGLGLGVLGSSMVGGMGGLGLGLLGAAGGYLLNKAGQSDQSMGFMDRINMLSDGWNAYQNMGNMSQGAQDALSQQMGMGSDTGLFGKFDAWTKAPQQYRDVASNATAMSNLNTILGDSNQADRLGQLQTFQKDYGNYQGTDSYNTLMHYAGVGVKGEDGTMSVDMDLYNSPYGKGVRQFMTQNNVTPQQLGGLGGQNLSNMLTNQNSVDAATTYLNNPTFQSQLGQLTQTKTKADLDNFLFNQAKDTMGDPTGIVDKISSGWDTVKKFIPGTNLLPSANNPTPSPSAPASPTPPLS